MVYVFYTECEFVQMVASCAFGTRSENIGPQNQGSAITCQVPLFWTLLILGSLDSGLPYPSSSHTLPSPFFLPLWLGIQQLMQRMALCMWMLSGQQEIGGVAMSCFKEGHELEPISSKQLLVLKCIHINLYFHLF